MQNSGDRDRTFFVFDFAIRIKKLRSDGVNMEKIKKARSVVRSAFTRTVTSFNSEASSSNATIDSLKITFLLLESKHNELEDLNGKLFEAMLEDEKLSEDDLAKEVENADEYREKYNAAKVFFSRVSDTTSRQVSTTARQNESSPLRNIEDSRSFKYPKVELRKFNGDPIEWLQFWSVFKKIHEDAHLSAEVKFQYLMQSMVEGSRASDLVNSYPPTAENYNKVIDT